MAGLNFIWSTGAASPSEVTKEIDFVPHILSCSSCLDGTVQCLVMAGQNAIEFSTSEYGWLLAVTAFLLIS